MKKWMKTVCRAMWCHRMAHAGLAAVYGAGCFGIVDKETLALIVAGLYVAMAMQRH